MKLVAQTTALQEALAFAGNIVATRTPKPVLQCVHLSADKDSLTLTTTDLEIGCKFRITAVKVEQPGEILVPSSRFTGIVRESSDESLSIETEGEACLVKGAGSKFKVFGYDPAEYPEVQDFSGDADIKVPAGILTGMIEKTVFATAKAHSHYAISGVLWEAEGKKLQMVATDGHRLARVKGTLTAQATKKISAITPAKLMTLVQRLSSDLEDDIEFQF